MQFPVSELIEEGSVPQADAFKPDNKNNEAKNKKNTKKMFFMFLAPALYYY